MARQTYNIGGQFFGSKAAVADHAKAIKDNAAPGTILEGQDMAFMLDLLRWHPHAAEKFGAGVRHILVRENPKYGHNEFYLRRVDGSGTDFSYKQCTQPSTPEADFRTALRVAAEPDIIAARNYLFDLEPVRYCPLTGERLLKTDGHMDHKPPNTFSQIVKTFVLSRRLNPAKVAVTGRSQDNSFRLRLLDTALEQDWVEYHRQHAFLRVISKTANLHMVGRDWDLILNYLHTTNHRDVLIEWKGKRWYYTHNPALKHGVFVAAERAPEGAPCLDGSVMLIEASLLGQGAD